MRKIFISALIVALIFSPAMPGTAAETSSAEVLASPAVTIQLTPEEQQYLAGVYKDTWNYLSTFVDPQTGIPYDSDKKQPATSLSNVGLYLSATAIAGETGLIPRQEALTRIHFALASLGRVPGWKGIPRVWFTARGLNPIRGTEMFSYSKHVSNFIAGLELAKAVFPKELGDTVDAWFGGMDLKSMYDPKTGWLNGGYDVVKNAYAVSQPFGPWYYKFLASEARLISFFLVAKDLAPASHWWSLSRTIQKENSHWYFVPNYEDGGAYMQYMAGLYVDERNTDMGLSQKNYSLAQMEQAQKMGAPVWGLSASLNTRGEYIPYGQLTPEIVAPYASMLAMIHFPRESVQNLQKLEDLGARPAGVWKDERTNFAAFTVANGVAKPWAILEDGDVFFMNKAGAIERLSAYIDWGAQSSAIPNYDRAAMADLIQKLGYAVDERRNVESYVKEVLGASPFLPGLSDALGDPAKWKDLLLLATAAGFYSPGEIRFRDGRKVQAAFIETNGSYKPWAVTTEKDVLFLDANGQAGSLRSLIAPANMNEAIKDVSPQACIDFAPALGLDASRSRQTGTETPHCAEYVLPSSKMSEDPGLIPDASPETALADLRALGFAAANLMPGQIKLYTETPSDFGFRDAIAWKTGAVEKHYLTPSQGMGFLALANVLHDQIVWKSFAKDPAVAKGMAVITSRDATLAKMSESGSSCYCPARMEA